jgi:hypothetical protein
VAENLPCRLIFLAALAISFASCTTSPAPTAANIAAAGGQISQDQAEKLVREYCQENLIDPNSMINLKVGTPQLASVPVCGVYNEWKIPFSCNSKNRMGGYTGQQVHALFVKNGQIDLQGSNTYESLSRSLEQ